MKGRMVVLLSVLAFVVAGCGSSAPPIASVAGTWVGTTSDSVVGAGNIRATIGQSSSALSGTWSSTYSNPSNNNGGTLNGSVSGSSVSLMLTPSVPTSCPFSVTATVTANQMSGTYASVSCSVAVTGSINVTRQ